MSRDYLLKNLDTARVFVVSFLDEHYLLLKPVRRKIEEWIAFAFCYIAVATNVSEFENSFARFWKQLSETSFEGLPCLQYFDTIFTSVKNGHAIKSIYKKKLLCCFISLLCPLCNMNFFTCFWLQDQFCRMEAWKWLIV